MKDQQEKTKTIDVNVIVLSSENNSEWENRMIKKVAS